MNFKGRVQTLEKKAELLPEVKPAAKYIWNKGQVEVIKKEVLAFFRIFPGRIEMRTPIIPEGLSLQEEGSFWLSNYSKIQISIGVLCNDDDIESEIFTYSELSGLTTMLKNNPRLRYPKAKGRKCHVIQK